MKKNDTKFGQIKQTEKFYTCIKWYIYLHVSVYVFIVIRILLFFFFLKFQGKAQIESLLMCSHLYFSRKKKPTILGKMKRNLNDQELNKAKGISIVELSQLKTITLEENKRKLWIETSCLLFVSRKQVKCK